MAERTQGPVRGGEPEEKDMAGEKEAEDKMAEEREWRNAEDDSSRKNLKA